MRELAGTFSYCVYAWWRRAGLDPVSTATASIACFERWLGEFPPQPKDGGVARMRNWMIARLPELAEQGVKLNGGPSITIDRSWAEKRYAEEPEGDPTSIFQRRWALTVIESAMTTLRDEYAARGEQNLYSELLGFAGYGQPDGNGYSSVSQRLGQTGGAIRKAVFEFRKRQREILLRYINDTVLAPADADSELTALLCACDETSSAPLPSAIQGLRPDEILVRAMRSVVMTQDGSGVWQPPTLEEADLLFPQYEIVSLVGRGGMGAVYRGRQIELDRAVAIKLLPLEVSVDPVFADRFRREARAMAKLHHPNIIAIHDFGATQEGHLFFVMEYVEGADLHQMIHGPGIAPAQALEIIIGVCDALAYAHGKGVVHRDIKPANVMVSRHGEVKVADFGLARLMDSGAEQIGHTVTGTVMGTPGYMAPEQMCGMNVDHRADIYSLGVMLYEMLCGEVPRGIFDPPSVRVPEVNSSIDQVVIKAMQQQPDRRYQTTAEMKTDVAVAAKPKPMVSKAPEPALAPSPLVPPQPAHKSAPEATPRGRRKAGAKSRNLAYFGIAAAMLAILGILIYAGSIKKNSSDSDQKTVSQEAASSPVPKQTIDLLALIDPVKDRIVSKESSGANIWEKSASILAYKSDGKAGKIASPVALHTKAYEIEVNFHSNVGKNRFQIDLPVSEKRVVPLAIGWDGSSIMLGGKKIGFIEASASSVTGGVVARVEPGAGMTSKVTVLIDGVQKAAWSGDLSSIGMEVNEPHADFQGEPLTTLGCPKDSFDFTSWKLRVYEGEARVLRGGTAVAPIASNPGSADTGKTLLFNGHRYQFMPGSLSWNEAKAKAEAMGGHLATVTSREENEWIYTTFQTKLDSTARASSMWLGGSAEANDQPWKWVTGEPFAYTDWTKGEPNYASMTGQPVAGPFGLVIKRHGKLCWFDDPMNRENSSAGFIVEWEHEGTADSATSAPLVVDLLALADVENDAEGGLWSRQGTDLLVAEDPASEKHGGIRFGFVLPVRVTGSYKLDVEFTRHGPRGTVSLVLPLPNNRSVAAHFQEASPYAGLASVRGSSTREKENPTRTPNQLEDGRRYRASVQVVLNGDQADITATLEGNPLFRFQGPVADLDSRGKLGFMDAARPGMKSIDPVTWHSVRITLLDGGRLTPARDDVALPAGAGNLK